MTATAAARKSSRCRLKRIVVIAIVLLAGVAFVKIAIVGRIYDGNPSHSKTRVQLQLLITGLKRHEIEFGSYPEPLDNLGVGCGGAKALYQALSCDGDNYLMIGGEPGTSPSTGMPGSTTEPLVEGIDAQANKYGIVHLLGGEFALIDPFGRCWHYRKHHDQRPGEARLDRDYDLWSTGGEANTDREAQWIKNW
jgi:hypothetical protein